MSDGSTAVELGEQMSMVGDDAPQDQPHQEACESSSTADPQEKDVVYSKRTYKSGEDRLAKRPRWGDKAFDDITIGDVETLVRRCAALEKKVETNAAAAIQLGELQKEKKGLEKEMTSVGSDEVARAKASIAKQFQAQMIWVFPWNAELKEGRSITASVPNVSPQLLKALGGSTSAPQKKQGGTYFDKIPVKQVSSTKKSEQPCGSALVLGGLTLKYIKTTCELQVETTYKFGNPEKAKEIKKARKGKKAAAKGDAVEDGEEVDADDADDCDEEEHVEEPALAEDGKAMPVDDEVDALAIGGQ